MAYRLWAVDSAAGQAVIRQGDDWYIVSIDTGWEPLLMDDARQALRWAIFGSAFSANEDYPSMESAIARIRTMCLAHLEIPKTTFEEVKHLRPRHAHREVSKTSLEEIEDVSPRDRTFLESWEPALSKEKGLTQGCFEQLLNLLGPNREEAAERYEAIRRRLIQIFTYRRCSAPEELADRTFDRVCEKIGEIARDYKGDPASYFYGVANWIYLDSFRHRIIEPPIVGPDPNIEVKDLCLEECLALLTNEDREMVLEYYRGEGRELIANRKKLAERLGISIESLRRKVFKLRHQLDKCITSCLEREGAA